MTTFQIIAGLWILFVLYTFCLIWLGSKKKFFKTLYDLLFLDKHGNKENVFVVICGFILVFTPIFGIEFFILECITFIKWLFKQSKSS